MGKKILLPTDFSKNSWNAIQYIMKMFKDHECDFYIMNAYSEESHGLESLKLLDPDDTFNQMSEKRSQERLGDIMVRLMLENTNSLHKFHVVPRPELFLDAIKSVAKELNIDMIVMGARGITNERKGKYGKNTLDVIENVRKCPVLIVPENVTFDRLKEIVLVTNFNTDFKVSEITYLAEIAKLSNTSIQILSLVDIADLSPKQKENKMKLEIQLKEVVHNFNLLHHVKMATALNCFVEIRRSNMISYIDKKPSIWERFGFGKPTLCKLGYYENVPVLALHG